MSIQLSVEIKDREDGELPNDNDQIVAFSPDNPSMKYRLMSGMFFRISSDARYWFSLEDLALDELHKIRTGGL